MSETKKAEFVEPLKDFKELFSEKMIALRVFCKHYTTIDPSKGLYHRMRGYNTSGNAEASLTEKDIFELKAGLLKLRNDIDRLI